MATIQGIYIALFGRPADPAGLAFFNAETNNGADLTAIGDLAATDEYQDRFTGLSNPEIINSIYQSLFGRDGEQEGIDFFVAALEDGTYNINNIAIAILDGAQGDDLATVNAKIAAANIFTAALDQDFEVDAYSGPDAAALARDFIDTVTIDDAGTQEEADAVIANIVNQGGGEPGNPGGGNPPPPVNDLEATGSVVISNVEEGATASVDITGVTDPNGAIIDAEYQWQRKVGQDWVDIADETGATYDITHDQAFVNTEIRVRVTTIDSSFGTTVFFSNEEAVADVNDVPLLSVKDGALTSIQEAKAATVVADFDGVDPDSADVVTFSLANGQDANYFTINSATGVLTLKADVDYEALGSDKTLNVTVVGEDSEGGQGTIGYSIDITDLVGDDVNDFDYRVSNSNNGDNNSNTIYGGTGSDTVRGFGGNDNLYGGSGNDTVEGSTGNDDLYGGSGNDTLDGGDNQDDLWGGLGNDTFYFEEGDSEPGSVDVIRDWNSGDKIDLSDIDAKEWSNTEPLNNIGNQMFDWGGQNTNPAFGEVSYYWSGGDTYVVADTTLENSEDISVMIRIVGEHNLSASDFIL